MERIVYRKTLDVHKNGIQFTLQGFETADNMARKIEISLMASGDAIDLPLEQITAVMYVTTPNATEPSINACTIKGNTIIYDVLPIVEEGITEMQLKLIKTGPNGAKGVLPSPRFAVEVTQSNTDDESATQTPTFTALEDAIARANGVYDSRLIGIELDEDCTFRAKYADGTIYESDVLKELFLKGDVLLSQSYAKGGTGIRAGEDTDNSMYYSNVSKSASAEASRISGEATELLEEVTKHGVYTSFSVDFETGEVVYDSPKYIFNVNQATGELEANGKVYKLGYMPIESAEFPGCFYLNVDGEKEWINPPMIINTSYKTIERSEGETVWVCNVYKNLDAGESYTLNIDKSEIKSIIGGYTYIDGVGDLRYLPLDSTMKISQDRMWNGNQEITITNDSTMSRAVKVLLSYIKV